MTDTVLTRGYMPRTWDEWIGQDEAKFTLQTIIDSALVRNATLGHILIESEGRPGLGKTTVASLVARYMGRHCHIESEPIPTSKLDYLFMDVKEGELLFLDELHRHEKAEWLLTYMESGLMPGVAGQDVPSATIMAATTEAGKIKEAILNRFENRIILRPYTSDEAALIAEQLGRRVLHERHDMPVPSDEVCMAIAAAGNNQPRQIRNLVEKLRDLVITNRTPPNGGKYDLGMALKMAQLTHDGLNRAEQLYLTTMWAECRGGPTGQATIRAALRETDRGLNYIELTLKEKKMLLYTKGGRKLTPDGARRAKELLAA